MKKKELRNFGYKLIMVWIFLNMIFFILVSFPSIIVEYYSYNYYISLAIVSMIISIISAWFTIKNKEKTIGYLFIFIGLVTACGCLITNNGKASFKAKVISISKNSIVVEKDDKYKNKNYYEIKKPIFINIKVGDNIYAKYDNKDNNIMHFVISPTIGRVIIIVGGSMLAFGTLYSGYRLLKYGYVIRNKKGKKIWKEKVN